MRVVATKQKPQAGRRKSLTSKRLRPIPERPSLLPMGKRPWSHKDFMLYLDELSRAAGIPNSKRGTPNTTVLEEYTDVSPTQVGRWRKGTHQPTTESLRMIARGLAPRAGLDPATVLAALEIKAGRRSEAELVAKEGLRAPEPESKLEARLRLVKLALDRPGIEAEERRELEIEQARLQAMQRMSEDTLSAADEVLRRYGHGAA